MSPLLVMLISLLLVTLISLVLVTLISPLLVMLISPLLVMLMSPWTVGGVGESGVLVEQLAAMRKKEAQRPMPTFFLTLRISVLL
jgi:hypothetical protein